ncbi:TPA: hypothetical protein R4345_001783, partial [Pasteurella multocida]|nr:hypothetical protein [Pasteurella multocida]
SDLIRPSTTNTADGGADLILEHTTNNLDEMLSISKGTIDDFSSPQNDNSPKIKTRIDVKAYENRKIPKSVAEKFIGDIKLNPDCDAHLLMGGDGLTKGAQEVIDNARTQLPERKRVELIDNEGIKNLNRLALLKANQRSNLSDTSKD